MSDIPAGLRFTAEHEWVKVEGEVVRMGITGYAQEQLGDLVYVELPPVGRKLIASKACGVVESVKAASDIFSPVTGTVAAINAVLIDEPELANRDPYGEGWMLVITPAAWAEVDALLDTAAYEALVAEADA
jgi:glycine cleavage system H protein